MQTLDQVVDVDYYVPGCPPESRADRGGDRRSSIAALDGEASCRRTGSVLGAGDSTVCDECPRERNVKTITAVQRASRTLPQLDPTLCLLEQGMPCNGPATRDGCGAKCPAAGAPCIGCYGAGRGRRSTTARACSSAFASVVDANEPEEIERILDGTARPGRPVLPLQPGRIARCAPARGGA